MTLRYAHRLEPANRLELRAVRAYLVPSVFRDCHGGQFTTPETYGSSHGPVTRTAPLCDAPRPADGSSGAAGPAHRNAARALAAPEHLLAVVAAPHPATTASTAA